MGILDETFNLRIYCLEKQSRLMSENVDFADPKGVLS